MKSAIRSLSPHDVTSLAFHDVAKTHDVINGVTAHKIRFVAREAIVGLFFLSFLPFFFSKFPLVPTHGHISPIMRHTEAAEEDEDTKEEEEGEG